MTKFAEHTWVVRLLFRKISGMITDKELKKLERWCQGDEQHERLYQEVTDFFFIKKQSERMPQADVTGAYLKVMEKCTKNTRRRTLRRVVAVAASLLLPFVLGVLLCPVDWKRPETGNQEMAMNGIGELILPGGTRAELQLADGSKVILNPGVRDSLLKQQGTQLVAGEKGLSYEDKSRMDELVYNSLKIPRGGEYTLTLGDGTIVFLNSETELRYPIQFVGNERRVYLSGEAYFEVVKNAEKPFVVETAGSKIEVLGTSFNVRSYGDEPNVATTLVEGEVRFISSVSGQVNLNPGEQGILDKSGCITKKAVDTYLYTAWKDGHFVFRKQSLEEVMRVIARWYDVEVFFIHPTQKNISFSGNIKRYDDFTKIIEMLEMTGDTYFEIHGKNIYIREK